MDVHGKIIVLIQRLHYCKHRPMDNQALQHLPQQGPLHSITSTCGVQEASIQLPAICACLINKVLDGKQVVLCCQIWPKASLDCSPETRRL